MKFLKYLREIIYFLNFEKINLKILRMYLKAIRHNRLIELMKSYSISILYSILYPLYPYTYTPMQLESSIEDTLRSKEM